MSDFVCKLKPNDTCTLNHKTVNGPLKDPISSIVRHALFVVQRDSLISWCFEALHEKLLQ